MENNLDSFHNELSIVISQQEILQQKVGILMAINTIVIGVIISLSLKFSYWILILLIFQLIAIFINIYIIYPNFRSNNDSKYFYNFSSMDIEEIEKFITSKNILEQIKVNSKILKNKYNLFRFSLIFSFFGIPLIFEIRTLCFKKWIIKRR